MPVIPNPREIKPDIISNILFIVHSLGYLWQRPAADTVILAYFA